MNKQFFTTLFLGAATFCASQVFASAADEKLFLEPHLVQVAGKAVFQAGHELAAEKKHTFDQALSVNIGMNVASTTHVVTKDSFKVTGLGAHMRTIAESLKENGIAIVAAPASYGTLFTTGTVAAADVVAKINQALEKIGTSEDAALIQTQLNALTDVSRATFARHDGKLRLVTDEKTLTLGQKVWRKNPSGAAEEIYHSEEEYLVAIRDAGLCCEEIKRPSFQGEVKWKAYNSGLKNGEAPLGVAYKDHNPFTIYKVVKKAA